MPRAIGHVYRAVETIRKQVIALHRPTYSSYNTIRIDKPSGFGIIVSALEIVQPRFGIIDIPAVAEGVQLTQRAGHGAGGGQRIAPCVIGISNHLRAAAVDQPGHVALRVLQIEVFRAIIGDGHGPQLVVGEVQGRAAGGRVNVDLRQRVTEVRIACPRSLARVDDLAAGVADVVDAAVLTDSVPVGIISEADHFRVAGSIGAGHLRQLAAVLPTVAPCAVIGKIANLVRCQQLSVIAGQQILPLAVAATIGDGVQCCAQRAGGANKISLCEEAVEENRIPPTVSALNGKKASLNFECSQNVYML